MSASLDRDHRAVRVAGGVLAALLISVVLANVLWPGAPSPAVAEPRMPPSQSPFPRFPLGPTLHAAKIDADANLSMRLLMTSLEGIVNRVAVELYLDVPAGVAGNTSQILSYLAARYNVTYDVISAQAAIDAYVRRAAGVVVYDPSRPESIDVGTLLAAQQNAVLAGPDLAGWLSNRYALPILFDYAQRPDWRSLDAVGAYDRALRELYPHAYPYLLAILPPDRWAIRDYLVQTGTFVFYLTQGILASPMEATATMRILAAARMWALWSESVRGTLPFAWSLNPLLVDLAPPLLDRYYDSATPLDRFLASPSGAGYLYPDYTGPGDLPSFVNFTKRYLDAADMDVVWLLNAFAASEITYTSASLSAYVDGSRPAGIVLDYDDQPRTRDAWMQAGAQSIAPVIRSTHFWTTADNALGKIDTAIDSGSGGPNFLWLTVYTFRFDLNDAQALVGELSRRSGGNLEIVTPSAFFDLLRADFVRTARSRLDTMEGDPIASILFSGRMGSARLHLQEADASLSAGDANRAAFASYLALEDLRSVSSAETLLASLLVVLLAAALAFVAHRSAWSGDKTPEPLRLGVLVIVTAAVALLVFALREALDQNFWTYPTILVAVAIAGIHRPLRRWLDRAYAARAPTAAALAALVFVALAIRTSAAFPLAVVGILLVIDAYMARRDGTSSEVLLGLAFGTAIGFLGGFDLLTFAVLSILLVVPTLTVHGAPVKESPGRRPIALIPGFVLALSLTALSVAYYYSLALRLEFQGGALLTTAGALLVLAPTLALVARRTHPRIDPVVSEVAGLALAVVFSGLVLLSHGAVPTILALLGLFASLSYAALAALDRFATHGGARGRALAMAILFLPLIVLFIRMPPIVISLTIARLPEAVESALYAPTVLIAAVALLLAVRIGLRHRLRDALGKDYDREAHGGPERP